MHMNTNEAIARIVAVIIATLCTYQAYLAHTNGDPRWVAAWVALELVGVGFYISAGYIDWADASGGDAADG